MTPAAVAFVTGLHERFELDRQRLLQSRGTRVPDGLLEATKEIRRNAWKVASPPPDLADRRVEITGPVDRKMVINALNSGANAFMADFEDANAPTWTNVIEGQANLMDAVRRTIALDTDNKSYALDEQIATLMVRPRGWHLVEKHFPIASRPVSASLFDFGFFFFHNANELIARDSGPYFYLPKLESHLEARLWNDVFIHAQEVLGLPVGTIRATVLIETLPAAFQMEEILFELRDHSGGLNAGRWDYIFSMIKNRRDDPNAVLPDRGSITMTVPFMQAYTDRLVATCHRRDAYAIGGMAAFIPNRHDQERNRVAFDAVRADKAREATQGFDGTWVAHPGLVPIAREAFDAAFGSTTNQLDRCPDVSPAASMLDLTIPGGSVTESGLRQNIRVAILYLVSWLRGVGAAALFDLMEDAATAEISRSQVWQWVAHSTPLDDGRAIDATLVRHLIQDEMATIIDVLGDTGVDRLDEAVHLFEAVSLSETFVDFLTLPAYELI